MNLKNIKSIGIEAEAFLMPSDGKSIIFNASKVMQEKLGFSVNPNYTDNSINLNNLKIVTDGTVMEFSAEFHKNYHSFADWLHKFYQNTQDSQRNPLFEGYRFNLYTCFMESNEFVTFDSPGNVHTSIKTSYNAYANESFYTDKKEEDKLVTKRTAGLHLHFEFNNPELLTQEKLNVLTIKLDEFKNTYMDNHLCLSNKKRQKLYPDGIYRIKEHFGREFKTYEYRSLTPDMITSNSGRAILEAFVINVDKEIGNL